MARIGRPPTCSCGKCEKCKRREYMRGWYQKKTLTERREWIAKRNLEKVRENDRRRYERHRPERIARMKEWAIQNPEKVREATRRWVEENPDKRKAHITVGNAVRDGRLLRQACEICGAKQVHAHHEDYSKPLEVKWLCSTHHAEHHATLRRAAR